ncbi:clathrin binding protein [Coccidioides immitis H538.4]|uniref:Clathrin binding protein n=1 Tax=Coccidioides immitis H538.4 TaxID=396776 RepID=A0A0J8RHA5_COCIT|nr:clathrin binding protein [Coccidioides immitis H538.4]
MNEGTINVLEHYFEMSRPDSERALRVYKSFSSLTEDVVRFLRVARQYENATRLEIPNLKHASTDLAKLLEDDLNDPDFAARRKEYRAQKYGKKEAQEDQKKATSSQPAKSQPIKTNTQSQPAKAPAPDLMISLILSSKSAAMTIIPPQQSYAIPQIQAFQATGFPQQQMGFATQQTGSSKLTYWVRIAAADSATSSAGQGGNPFAQFASQPQQQLQPLQPSHTGAGFGGYTPQPQSQGPAQPQMNNFQPSLSSIPQNGVPPFQQPMQTGSPRPNNPFRQSMLIPTSSPFNSNSQPAAAPLTRQPTNPFAKHRLSQMPLGAEITRPSTSPGIPPQDQTYLQPLRPQRTGNNPFARNTPSPNQNLQVPAAAPLRPNPTGSTNPFRQSAFINQQTGQPWQVGVPQGTMGGLENLPTVPVFPRPGQTT